MVWRIVILLLVSNICFGQNCVPDSNADKKIAEEKWLAVYGKMVLDEKPYLVYLIGDSVWAVSGTLHPPSKIDTINGQVIYHVTFGGSAYIEIRKKDCKVLKVIHYK